MKLWRVAAMATLGAAIAIAFAGWLRPDNVFALAATMAFCQ